MHTPQPCVPSSPFSSTDRASLRVPCVSSFGTDYITLILRRDGRLGTSAGEVAHWRREGDAVVCYLEKSYDWQPDAVFVVKESHALVALLEGGGA